MPTEKKDRNAWEWDEVEKKIKVNATKKAELDSIKADKEADEQALADLVAEKKLAKAQV